MVGFATCVLQAVTPIAVKTHIKREGIDEARRH